MSDWVQKCAECGEMLVRRMEVVERAGVRKTVIVMRCPVCKPLRSAFADPVGERHAEGKGLEHFAACKVPEKKEGE